MDGVETQIMIVGRKHLNRAIQGDIIAVELLPKSEWLKSPTAVVLEEGKCYFTLFLFCLFIV